MTANLPDDPYHALGLSKDATTAAIKTAYRKLVLKHHPDKVQDETLKQSAADLFHKVQSAWETIGDEDKRTRYDAQCRLAALRKEAMDRDRSSAAPPMRPQAAYRSSTDSRSYQATPRDYDRSESYRTQEVRPQETDYFDKQRSRDFDDRSRRTPPKEDRRSKVKREDSKESERLRHREKDRQATRNTTQGRDYKYASYSRPDVESDSESDHYAERSRSAREREEEIRARERHLEQTRRQQEEAASSRYTEDRTSRRTADARDYIERSARRPSPQRMSSSRDQLDFIKGSDGRPVAIRRGSGRPKASSRDDVDPPRRRRDVERSSSEFEEAPRRPPGLAQAKSAPHDIHLPYDKPRANSAQLTREQMSDFMPTPVKRADSMPLQSSRSKPVRQSTLRQTQVPDDFSDRRKASPPQGRSPRKEYADDYEKPTPDGYVIEQREPGLRTRSPEPIREKARSSSTRYASQTTPTLPPLNTRTTSKQYIYSPEGVTSLPTRPKLSRGESSRKESSFLYGEIPTSASPRDRSGYTAPMPENIRYQEIKPDYKMQAGYSTSRRTSDSRSPSYYRQDSYNSTPPMPAEVR